MKRRFDVLGKGNENREVRSSWDMVAEESSFDELAKGIASGTISRGKALKLVGAAGLSAMLVALFPGHAQAKKKRHRKKKHPIKCKPGHLCKHPSDPKVHLCCPSGTNCCPDPASTRIQCCAGVCLLGSCVTI